MPAARATACPVTLYLWPTRQEPQRSALWCVDLCHAGSRLPAGTQWKVQSYANIAWSMGQLGLEWPRLSQLILSKAEQCIGLLTPLDVAHLLWGLATVDEDVPQDFIRRCMVRGCAYSVRRLSGFVLPVASFIKSCVVTSMQHACQVRRSEASA